MRIATRQLLPSLFLLACLHPIPGMACAILPPDKDRTNHIPMDEQAMSGLEEAGFVRGR